MEKHANKLHGVINCDKCEYGALDMDILKKHKKTHTGNIIFTCNVCEFESTKQSLLENHKESKHQKKREGLKAYYCEMCEKTFPTSLTFCQSPFS